MYEILKGMIESSNYNKSISGLLTIKDFIDIIPMCYVISGKISLTQINNLIDKINELISELSD